MKELIRIDNNGTDQAVSARVLYDFLEVKTDFTTWFKRMFEYGFTEGKDYTVSKIEDFENQFITKVDYILTLDTAKEISMIQRTEKGKQARQYFIEIEKMATKPMTTSQMFSLQAKINVEHELRMSRIEEKMHLIEANTTTRPQYFTVAGYASLIRKKVGDRTAATLGRRASKLCQEKGFNIDQVHDARYGKVGSYPQEILQEIFNTSGL